MQTREHPPSRAAFRTQPLASGAPPSPPPRGVTNGIAVQLLGIAITITGVAVGIEPYENGAGISVFGVGVAVLGLLMHFGRV